MTSKQFLEILAQSGLVPARAIDALRMRVELSAGSITPQALCRRLVSQGYLTSAQAVALVSSSPPRDASPNPPTATGSDPASSDEELGLAPLDDDEPVYGAPPPTSLAGASSVFSDQLVDDDLPPPPLIGGDQGDPFFDDGSFDTPSKASPSGRPSLSDDDDYVLESPADDAHSSPLSDANESQPPLALTDDDADDSIFAVPPFPGPPPEALPPPPVATVERIDEESTLGVEDDFALLDARHKDLETSAAELNRPTPRGAGGGKRSEWDSPLLLIGGGVLAVMLLIGGTIWYMLGSRDANELMQQADDYYRAGSYTQAIASYSEVVDRFPNDAVVGKARVQRGMAQIRQTVEGTTAPERSLEVASGVLGEIEEEDAFPAAREDLRVLLPQIAASLAQAAQQEADPGKARQRIESTRQALALINTARYIPPSMRPEQQMVRILASLQTVERRLARDDALAAAVGEIDSAAHAGRIAESYERRDALLREYPELEGRTELVAAAGRIVQAEQALVRTAPRLMSSLTTDRDSPAVTALVPTQHRGGRAPTAVGRFVCVQIDDTAYGLDASSGQVMWRRFVGFDQGMRPAPLNGPGDDVLLCDAANQELIRVRGATGQVVWRLEIDERFATPTIAGGFAWTPTRSGSLLRADLENGGVSLAVGFPQPLGLRPGLDPERRELYVVGQRSSLFVLSMDDLSCRQAIYLGHAPGTVEVPPTAVADQVFVAENSGRDRAKLHVLFRDEQGLAAGDSQVTLEGRVSTPLLVFGRYLIGLTEHGQMRMFEPATGDSRQSPTEVASVELAGPERQRFAIVDGDRIWVGDSQLSRYQIQAATGRLAPQGLESVYVDAVFDYPLQIVGDILVHVRRPDGQAGVAVAATDRASGRLIWETVLSPSPIGGPLYDPATGKVRMSDSQGAIYAVDAAAAQSGEVAAQFPPGSERVSPRTEFGDVVQISPSVVLLIPKPPSDRVLRFDADSPARNFEWITMPEVLASRPVPFGGGILAPSRLGRILWLDLDRSAPLADPFQPRLDVNALPMWSPPLIIGGEPGQFVVSDGRSRLYRVSSVQTPSPHLDAKAECLAGGESPTSEPTVVGQSILTIDDQNHLAFYRLPDLVAGPTVDLEDEILAGPFGLGDVALIATAGGQLLAASATSGLRWRQAEEFGQLVGAARTDEDECLALFGRGVAARIDLRSGETLASLDMGQSVAVGPVITGSRFAAIARDGTLLLVDTP